QREQVRQRISAALLKADHALAQDVLHVSNADAERVAQFVKTLPGVHDAYADRVVHADGKTPTPTLTPTLPPTPTRTPTPPSAPTSTSTPPSNPTSTPTPTSGGSGPVNDPYYTNQSLWGINKIQADTAWSTSTGSGVKVAVLDCGINFSNGSYPNGHPD